MLPRAEAAFSDSSARAIITQPISLGETVHLEEKLLPSSRMCIGFRPRLEDGTGSSPEAGTGTLSSKSGLVTPSCICDHAYQEDPGFTMFFSPSSQGS